MNNKLFLKSKNIMVQLLSIFLLCISQMSCDDYERVYVPDPIPEPEEKWILNESKSDEFDVWNQSKWRTDLWFATSSDFAFNPENTSVRDGNLVISAKKETYNGKNYTSGVARSKFTVGGNSRVEIRAKLPDYRAHITAALWLSDKPVIAKNPNFEIDILETFLLQSNDIDRFTSGMHYWWIGSNAPEWVSNVTDAGDQSLGWYNHTINKPLSDDWHIWAIERYDNRIDFYFDGQLYWRHDVSEHNTDGYWDSYIPEEYRKHFNEQKRDIIFNIEGHAGSPIEEYMPVELLIDYVRVYDLRGGEITDNATVVVNSELDGTDEEVLEWAQNNVITLRYAATHETDRDSIKFDTSLAGKVITIKDKPILIERTVVIDGENNNIKLDGGDAVQLMSIDDGIDDEAVSIIEATILNLTFQNGKHIGESGGAISVRDKLTLEGCIFENNFSNKQAGAIIVYKVLAASELHVNRCLFKNNSAQSDGFNTSGGAIASANEGSGQIKINIKNSIFISNNAKLGGAVASWYNAETWLYNNLFYDNNALEKGGAYYGNATQASLGGNLFIGNSANTVPNEICTEISWMHIFLDLGYNVYQNGIVNSDDLSFTWGATSKKLSTSEAIITVNSSSKEQYTLTTVGDTETRIVPQSFINGNGLGIDYSGKDRVGKTYYNAGANEK